MEEKTIQNIKKTIVGDRSIYYGEVFIIKDRKLLSGSCEAKDEKEARRKLRETIKKEYGNKKYKIKQIFKLTPEFEIEEVE